METSYCDPGRHANVITPCLLTPCLNVPNECRLADESASSERSGKLSWCHAALMLRQSFRSGKLQNESFPNFSNFRPDICSEFCSEFSLNFSRSFRASFPGRRRPEKIHQKSPPFFNAKFPGKYEKNIHKHFLESRQSNNHWLSSENGIVQGRKSAFRPICCLLFQAETTHFALCGGGT